jgi:predicted O-methyltransferase YrrM
MAVNVDPRFSKLPVQDLPELAAFVKLVKEQKVCSYLEIGSKYGGSFWHVVRAMPTGSVAVAVDLPFGSTFKRPFSEPYLLQCVEHLRAKGYDAHCILGDSTNEGVIRDVQQRAPYDLCLIDGNHNEPYVRADWANYGPMAKIVAFHDISWDMAKNPGKLNKIDVPKVWNEIKAGYRYQEIRLCPTKRDNGFGVLWRC